MGVLARPSIGLGIHSTSRRTVLYQRRGAGDPPMTVAGAVIWRASRTPEGVATLALRETHPGVIRGAAWGPGADWALAQLPALCGDRR